MARRKYTPKYAEGSEQNPHFFESLDEAGWFTIQRYGQENVYFTLENGEWGFCKCL